MQRAHAKQSLMRIVTQTQWDKKIKIFNLELKVQSNTSFRKSQKINNDHRDVTLFVAIQDFPGSNTSRECSVPLKRNIKMEN